MTKKNATKDAARARKAEHGGSYQANLRQVGGGGPRPDETDELLRTCDVCGEHIKDLAGSRVTSGPFGEEVRRIYADHLERAGLGEPDWNRIDPTACEEIRKGPAGAFVNAVARCYFVEFQRFYEPADLVDDHIVNNQVALDFMRTRLNAEKRLPPVLRNYPVDQDLWLVVHDDCLRDDYLHTYDIEMSRISTAAKAIEWTIHLSEKPQWNPKGWVYVLANLFGRVAA
jgi:hypothetical protein